MDMVDMDTDTMDTDTVDTMDIPMEDTDTTGVKKKIQFRPNKLQILILKTKLSSLILDSTKNKSC